MHSYIELFQILSTVNPRVSARALISNLGQWVWQNCVAGNLCSSTCFRILNYRVDISDWSQSWSENCKIKMIINSIFSLHLGANHEEHSGNRTRKTAPFRITASVQLKMTTAANRNDSLFVAFHLNGNFPFLQERRNWLFFFFPKTFAVSLYISVPIPYPVEFSAGA